MGVNPHVEIVKEPGDVRVELGPNFFPLQRSGGSVDGEFGHGGPRSLEIGVGANEIFRLQSD